MNKRAFNVVPGRENGEGIVRGIIIALAGDKMVTTQMTSGWRER